VVVVVEVVVVEVVVVEVMVVEVVGGGCCAHGAMPFGKDKNYGPGGRKSK
jgi:hypothetical protein